MFVHLHNHTDYSLLDGAATVKGYVRKAKELGMNSVAITDHGNMFGALTFYNACLKEGIKPIIGCEFYVAPGRRDIRAVDGNGDRYYHLILLAMDNTGYHNLMKLNSIAWTEGFYYKPRIDRESIEKYNEGLICLSACIAGEVPKAILRNDLAGAMEAARWYKNVFGDRYYLEVQNHGIAEEEKVDLAILETISPSLGIPIVCTNDVHYIEKEDWDIHDTLLCIGTKKKKTDTDRLSYQKGEFYFRTEDEMRKLFGWCPEAVENTVRIADRCNLKIELPGPVLPKCPIPDEFSTDDGYLRHLAHEGLQKRYPDADREKMEMLEHRLDEELDTIAEMDFPAYFLIVQDYINWAKRNEITVGPGRGSGAGSLVAYSVGITDVDPIKFDLLFERFLNRERVSLPDFDVDFSDERRLEVVDYVSRRYGSDHVGQIATFGTLKAKAVVKDVARVFDLSPAEANEVTALIPDSIEDKKEVLLEDALAASPALSDKIYGKDSDPRWTRVFETAKKLEGLVRHTSLHAAGVVIGRERLDHYVPLCKPEQDKMPATQYPMTQIEDCGLVKMDFLGLKTLTLIDHTVELIRKRCPEFRIDSIPENDSRTMDMLRSGDSDCVFQFESKGMQDVLRKAQPKGIDDLVALNALYRPGPMQFIDKFVEGRHHPETISYPDPALEELLKPTYGVIVYQEQVMKAAQIIAGYTLGQADILRRIMGKKKKEALAAELVKFIDGAVAKGHSKEHAEEIFHILEPFAGYGFNKSHAVAYTLIAYRTAYLKAHYPAEFMAANLTNEIGSPEKFTEYLALCRKKGLKLLPPSVNESEVGFSVEKGAIRYGLSGIRNIGSEPASAIVREREAGKYAGFADFISRSPDNVLNTRVIEALICSGCFEEDRSVLLASYDEIVKTEKAARRRTGAEQPALFEMKPEYVFSVPEKKKSIDELLDLEKEMLGCYISMNPLDVWPADLLKSKRLENGRVRFLGKVRKRRDFATRKGDMMATLSVETPKRDLECVVFPKQYSNLLSSARPGNDIIFYGRYEQEGNDIRFFVDMTEKPDEALKLK